MSDILITTLYGYHTKQALVNLTVQSADWSVQMTPEEAQELGLNLIAASESAINDAFLLEYLRDEIKMGNESVAGILENYRNWRKERLENQDGT